MLAHRRAGGRRIASLKRVQDLLVVVDQELGPHPPRPLQQIATGRLVAQVPQVLDHGHQHAVAAGPGDGDMEAPVGQVGQRPEVVLFGHVVQDDRQLVEALFGHHRRGQGAGVALDQPPGLDQLEGADLQPRGRDLRTRGVDDIDPRPVPRLDQAPRLQDDHRLADGRAANLVVVR